MSENWPQKCRKSIFEVKNSIFHFISRNDWGIDCNLSHTFRNNIFVLLGSLKSRKAAFADYKELQVSQKWCHKFRKSIFEVKKSIFHFISKNHWGMDCNLSKTFKNNTFAPLKPLKSGKTAFTDCRKLQMSQKKRPQKVWKSIFGLKKSIFWCHLMNLCRMDYNLPSTFKTVLRP